MRFAMFDYSTRRRWYKLGVPLLSYRELLPLPSFFYTLIAIIVHCFKPVNKCRHRTRFLHLVRSLTSRTFFQFPISKTTFFPWRVDLVMMPAVKQFQITLRTTRRPAVTS